MSTETISGTQRLRTFEIDAEEDLIVMTGRDEQSSRTIYRGRGHDGRYCILLVDELAVAADPVDPDALATDSLQVVGRTAVIGETGRRSARFCIDDVEIVRCSGAGVYGLVWIPVAESEGQRWLCPTGDAPRRGGLLSYLKFRGSLGTNRI